MSEHPETDASAPAEGPATDLSPPAEGPAPEDAAYRVLARKYRPQTFAELIGQDALVRTLTNAIRTGRLAHAFVLTGVRGVGKTTTARIIAKALNCTGPDGKGGPTAEPCGVCDNCRAIAGDRHVDVMEMDAASRTGVDDIREIIDGVRYGPVAARYKVYIIDEIHMLTRNAFNALLKTLEEPPEHVKFVFATTEIRKVPVTVLSRCQRFDLPRVPQDLLVRHFTAIAEKEKAVAEGEAIAMIARTADGSVRDGLSLLDQAISQGYAGGEGRVTAEQVRHMLGLADRTRVIELFDQTLRGDAPAALETLSDMHRLGADPLQVLQDLLDFTHFLTRAKLLPQVLDDPAVPEAERAHGKALAEGLGVPVLTRCWQMLLKGVNEVQMAPQPEQAIEMVLIRLLHAAHLPTPGDVVRKLEAGAYDGLPALGDGGSGGGGVASGGGAPAGASPGFGGGAGGGFGGGTRAVAGGYAPGQDGDGGRVSARGPFSVVAGGARPEAAPPAAEPVDPSPASLPAAAEAAAAIEPPADFRRLVRLFEDRGRADLSDGLYTYAHLVRYDPAAGRLEFRPGSFAPKSLSQEVGRLLLEWTGRRWMVSLSDEPGERTLAQQDAETKRGEMDRVRDHPVVAAVLSRFPGARLVDIHAPEDEPMPGLPLAAEAADDDMAGIPADPTAPPPEDDDE